ncbi:MAG: thrombospondin type 3 repeat-containing protein [Candidatus Micrarchaeota archaeon]
MKSAALLLLVIGLSLCYAYDGYCGDEICDAAFEENPETCPEDCEGVPPEEPPPEGFCGDTRCNEAMGENQQNCPEDCGSAPPEEDWFCGDGTCNDGHGESYETCPEDCDAVPQGDNDQDQDGILNPSDYCPFEPEVYNDFQDEDGCPDTTAHCGDDICNDGMGENQETCPEDCGWPEGPSPENDTGPTTIVIFVDPLNFTEGERVKVEVVAEDPDGIDSIVIVIDDEPVDECASSPCDYEGGPYDHPVDIGAYVRDKNGITKYSDNKEPWDPESWKATDVNITIICNDTDGGKNYLDWGFVLTSKKGAVHPSSAIDQCVNGTHLKEYFCTASGFADYEVFDCQGGCCNGACGFDTDNDNIFGSCDNCPYKPNADQKDNDSDGVGDACDNCNKYNPTQTDWDGDGVADGCDNCPYTVSFNQNDSDGDGWGNICDNCPTTFNIFQDDFDGDGIGAVCDNCPNVTNADQANIDYDKEGDACDCNDGFRASLNETGVDCGGICTAACPTVTSNCFPIMVHGSHNDKIDVVFVRNTTYSSTANFANDTINLVKNFFNDPILAAGITKFNFYYYSGATATINSMCKYSVPNSLWQDCSFAQSVAIVHTAGWRDCSSGNTFSVGHTNYKVMRHESGHNIFGLADEYCCDGGYWQPSPNPNIYSSLQNCENDAPNLNVSKSLCRQICENGKCVNWWKSDPDSCTMLNGQNFSVGCQRRVSSVWGKYK